MLSVTLMKKAIKSTVAKASGAIAIIIKKVAIKRKQGVFS